MAKKDFLKKQMSEDTTSIATQAILKNKKSSPADSGAMVKVCLRLPKKQLAKLKKKKLDLELKGTKTSVQDLIIEAIDETL